MAQSIDVSVEVEEPTTLNGSVESIPYGVKKRLVLCNSFYLPNDIRVQMIRDVEHNVPRDVRMSDMEYVVRTIDRYGDWLHS